MLKEFSSDVKKWWKDSSFLLKLIYLMFWPALPLFYFCSKKISAYKEKQLSEFTRLPVYKFVSDFYKKYPFYPLYEVKDVSNVLTDPEQIDRDELKEQFNLLVKLVQKKGGLFTQQIPLTSLERLIIDSSTEEEFNFLKTELKNECVQRGVLEPEQTLNSVSKEEIIRSYVTFLRGQHFDFLNQEKEYFVVRDHYLGHLLRILKTKNDNTDYSKTDLKKAISKQEEEIKLNNLENLLAINSLQKIDKNRLEQMTGHEFEDYVALLLKQGGYRIVSVNKSHDQGGDIVVEDKFLRKKIAIQTKKYSGPVGNSAVKDALLAKHYYNCNESYVITNSSFTKSALEAAESANVRLLDGVDFRKYARKGMIEFTE